MRESNKGFREIQVAKVDTFSKDVIQITDFWINENVLIAEVQKKIDARLDSARNSLNMSVSQWRQLYRIPSAHGAKTPTAETETDTSDD